MTYKIILDKRMECRGKVSESTEVVASGLTYEKALEMAGARRRALANPTGPHVPPPGTYKVTGTDEDFTDDFICEGAHDIARIHIEKEA